MQMITKIEETVIIVALVGMSYSEDERKQQKGLVMEKKRQIVMTDVTNKSVLLFQ